MSDLSVSHFVKNDNTAYFNRYRCGNLYYRIVHNVSGDIYEFSVPIEDLQQATVERNHRAMPLMRYIRQAIEQKTLTKVIDTDEKHVTV